jgi:hypothetical protein
MDHSIATELHRRLEKQLKAESEQHEPLITPRKRKRRGFSGAMVTPEWDGKTDSMRSERWSTHGIERQSPIARRL